MLKTFESRTVVLATSVTAAVFLFLFASPSLAIATDDDAQTFAFHKTLPHYNQPGDSLRYLLSLSGGTHSLKIFTTRPAGSLDELTREPAKDVFRSQICGADVVLIGSVTTIKTFLSANETQVFTDYSIAIVDVLKDVSKANLHIGGHVIVTQPGGTIHIDGGEISQLGASFPSPMFPGKAYLLALSVLSDSQSFKKLGDLSTYLLDGSHVRTISEDLRRDSMNTFLLGFSPGLLRGYIEQSLGSCKTP